MARTRARPARLTAVSGQLAKVAREDQSAVLIFGSSLPHIVPNVLLNKREVRQASARARSLTAAACEKDLIPVILSVIRNHPEHAVRDHLTSLLFNLAKKPDDAFRWRTRSAAGRRRGR